MHKWLFTILFLYSFYTSKSQDENKLNLYEKNINNATTDVQKIEALTSLSEYYSIFKLDSKSDSVLQKALQIAEVSNDKSLIIKILFNNEIVNLNAWNSKSSYEKIKKFINIGLDYALEINRPDYVAQSYIRLASVAKKRSQFNEAIQYTTQAFTALSNNENDTLKGNLYKELGDIYLAMGEAVPAYKNFNSAYEIAYKQKNIPLQSDVYHRFSDMYRTFGDKDMAKKYLIQSLQLNLNAKNTEGEYLDYIDLARITDEKDYIDKAIILAEKLKKDRYILASKRLLFFWYMVQGKNSDITFQYLNTNKDLIQYFQNNGLTYYNFQIGNIYRYSSKLDSAIQYFKKAELDLQNSYDNNIKLLIYSSLAETYLQNKENSNALYYYEKVFDISKQLNQISSLPKTSTQLAKLYEQTADYKKAYYFLSQADSSNHFLDSLSAKDKVVLLQVDRENKKIENDKLEQEIKTKRKHNLQILAIVVTITLVFAFMLFLGMFAVSKVTIRMVGYFAFISLFEFIIVLLEHPIIELSHGEPFKLWGMKIVIIAILVPIQNFLEHKLIHFLQSRKLLEARQKFSLTNWWNRLKKTAPKKLDAEEKENNE